MKAIIDEAIEGVRAFKDLVWETVDFLRRYLNKLKSRADFN